MVADGAATNSCSQHAAGRRWLRRGLGAIRHMDRLRQHFGWNCVVLALFAFGAEAQAPAGPAADPVAAAKPAKDLGPDGHPLYSNALAGTELRQALADLADASGVTIICDELVGGVVTVEFKAMPFTAALELLLAPGGYVSEELTKGVFVVVKPDPASPSFRQIAKVSVITLRNAHAADIEGLTPDAFKPFIKVDAGANRVVVLAPRLLSTQIAEWIQAIDRDPRPELAQPSPTKVQPLELRYLTASEFMAALPASLRSSVAPGHDEAHVLVTAPAKEAEDALSQVRAFDSGADLVQVIGLKNLTAKGLKDLLPATLKASVSGQDDSTQVLLTVPPRQMAAALAQIEAIDRAFPPTQATSTSTAVVPLSYIDGAAVLKLLPKTYAAFVQAEDAGRRVFVTAPSAASEAVIAAVKALDRPPTQVMIEALVVEASRDDLNRFEVSAQDKYWGGSNAEGTVFYGGPATSLLHKVLWLVENEKAKVKASPRVVAQDGKEASVRLSINQYFSMVTGNLQSQYVTLEAIEAAIGLTMTPRVALADRMVTCTLQPEVGDVSGTGTNALPIITKRTASTTVRVADGQTIAIGGLLQETEQAIRRKIPLLGDLPLVGGLFRSSKTVRTQREITIFVVPHILDEQGNFTGPLLFERFAPTDANQAPAPAKAMATPHAPSPPASKW